MCYLGTVLVCAHDKAHSLFYAGTLVPIGLGYKGICLSDYESPIASLEVVVQFYKWLKSLAVTEDVKSLLLYYEKSG